MWVSSPVGWPCADLIETSRLIIEPLRVAHADEIARVLDDLALHEFTGGEPQTLEQLRNRYSRLVLGQSPDGKQGWLNWIVRDRGSAVAIGTVQATLHRTEGALSAELAWVIGAAHQRQGYAREAASGLVAWLRQRGVRLFSANVHPQHAASIAVARHLGLGPSDVTIDGETRWAGVDC